MRPAKRTGLLTGQKGLLHLYILIQIENHTVVFQRVRRPAIYNSNKYIHGDIKKMRQNISQASWNNMRPEFKVIRPASLFFKIFTSYVYLY